MLQDSRPHSMAEPLPGREQLRDLPEVRVLPYDYVADLDLTGKVGNLVQDVINVSVEGVFVAVAIGYGLDEEPGESLELILRDDDVPQNLGHVKLCHIPPDLLLEGFRINPELAAVVQRQRSLDDVRLDVAPDLLQRLRPTDDFSFLLNIVDAATGRELQNEPVHSLATLGDPRGRRPFKMLPQPMVFMPRSTIRVQIEERTNGVRGRLCLALQGYKLLGQGGRYEAIVRQLGHFDPRLKVPVYEHGTGSYRHRDEVSRDDFLHTGIVPFDYVSTLNLTGRRGHLVEDEVPVNVDGGYLATALSYSLDVGDPAVLVDPDDGAVAGDLVDLGQIRLGNIRPLRALFEGLRVHPLRARFAFAANGRPAQVPRQMLGRMLQSLNRPDAVSFRYTITDSGTGRELQSQPVHNVAGLGIANGERPFRVLHKPMVFLPRSTIRVQVEERRGAGRLFLVFQGFKVVE